MNPYFLLEILGRLFAFKTFEPKFHFLIRNYYINKSMHCIPFKIPLHIVKSVLYSGIHYFLNAC